MVDRVDERGARGAHVASGASFWGLDGHRFIAYPVDIGDTPRKPKKNHCHNCFGWRWYRDIWGVRRLSDCQMLLSQDSVQLVSLGPKELRLVSSSFLGRVVNDVS